MTPLVAAVAALAVYRLTILVVADDLTEPLRKRAVKWLNVRKHGPPPSPLDMESYGGPTGEAAFRLDRDLWRQEVATDPHRVAFLLECPWCASPYVAAPVVAWTVLGDPGRLWWIVCGTAAASGVAAFLATKASPS